MSWETICQYDYIPDNTGLAALVDGHQVAIFKVRGKLYAIDNFDPVGKANVLSRGIICSLKRELCVASPLYKQHFSLVTGRCFEEDASVRCYAIRCNDGIIEIDKSGLQLRAA